MFRKVKRIGAEKTAFIFTVDVKRIVFSGDNYYDYDGALLSVCFERGGKLASSKDKLFNTTTKNKDDPTHILEINEPLSLLVTLYKDSHSDYQEKIGKLILRQFKKSKNILSNSYVGLGSCKLSLHQLVNELIIGPKEYIWPIDGIDDVTVHVKVSIRIINKSTDDDGMSMISDQSDVSAVAAIFDTNDNKSKNKNNNKNNNQDKSPFDENEDERETHYDEDDEKDSHNNSSSRNLPQGQKKTGAMNMKGISSALESIPEGYSSNTRNNTNSSEDQQAADNNEDDEEGSNEKQTKYSNSNSNSQTKANNNSSSPARSTNTSNQKDSSSTNNYHTSSNNDDDTNDSTTTNHTHVKRFPFMSPSSSGSSGTSSSSSSGQYKSSILSKRTTSEVLELQTECNHLRRLLSSKEEEMTGLKQQIMSREEEHKNQFMVLRTDLNLAQAELKRLKVGRSAVAVANERADGVLASALARAREETAAIAEEYASTAAALTNTENELQFIKQQLIDMTKLREEDHQASIEAATIASAAAFRRAEIESENNGLIDDLIDIKMNYANMALDFEEEKRKLMVLRKRLQKYAERVATLEVSKAVSNYSENSNDYNNNNNGSRNF